MTRPPVLAAGQVWRLRTVDGPALLRVVRLGPLPTRGRRCRRGRPIMVEAVAGRVALDDWRELDLTASPNAELVG